MPKIEYNSLLSQISKILEETKKDFKEGSNRFVLESNWEIGKRISEMESGLDGENGYGKKIVVRLSRDLNNKFGNGYSEKSLWNMRKFHQMYKLNKIRYELSWTHYRALLFVKEQGTRNNLERRAAELGWTRRKLEAEISVINSKNSGKIAVNPGEIGFLERPKGQFYHYQIRKTGALGKFKDTLPRGENLDLGFYFFLNGTLGDTAPLSLKGGTGQDIAKGVNRTNGGKGTGSGSVVNQFKDGEIVRVMKTGMNDYKFEKTNVSRSEIFIYKAFMERIVDGDTLLVTIDLGFCAMTKQRIRLRGIDSPEKGSLVNSRVEKFIGKRLDPSKYIVVKTHSVDIFGRYVADVFYPSNVSGIRKNNDSETGMIQVLEKGVFLNNELLGSGLVSVE